MRVRGHISGLFEGLARPKTARVAVQIVLVRVIPGAINVGVLLALAGWLSRESYGLASTFMATATAAATFLFGPILQPALVQHAEHSEGKEQRAFEHSHTTNALLLSGVIGLIGGALSFADLLDWRMVASTAAFGLYTALLQITRSRLQFVSFGIGSTAQSVTFLLLAYILVKPAPSTERVLEAFATSYFLGALLAGALVNARLAKPSLKRIKESVAIGVAPTLSNVAESLFSLGSRYLLVGISRVDALGTYSFSLDLAQKTVGIFINIAMFGILPHALKATDVRQMWRALARGSSAAALVSMSSAAFVLVLGLTSWIPALNSRLFNPLSFLIVALAVVINRTAKMMFTAVAMRVRRSHVQLIPVMILSPLGLLLVWIGTVAFLPYSIELGYFLTLTAWNVWGYLLLRPKIRNQRASG